jgi:hypothetical protein
LEADDATLRGRLIALRMQKAELDRDIERQQASVQTGQATITPAKLKALSLAMQKRLAEGPPELRQAYMRLILDSAVRFAAKRTRERDRARAKKIMRAMPPPGTGGRARAVAKRRRKKPA